MSSILTPVSRALRLFLLILAACFAFEWTFALVNTYLTHLPYPYTSPLSKPGYHFSDWLNYIPHAWSFGQPHFLIQQGPGFGLPFAYPIPCIYVYVLFFRLFPAHTLGAYITFSVIAFLLVTLFFSRFLYRRGAPRIFQLCAWGALLLGLPVPFLIERGNFEVFVWLLVTAALAAFIKDWKYTAAFFFALAACTKIYPAIFFLLFLPRRQYLPIVFGAAMTAGVFALALFGAGRPVSRNLGDIAAISKMLHDEQIVHTYEDNLRWDHALLSEPKAVLYTVDRAFHLIAKDDNPSYPRMIQVYGILAPLSFLALYLLRLRRLPLLNQFAGFSLCSILLPYISYEYTLVVIDLVLAAFLLTLLEEEQQEQQQSRAPLTFEHLRPFAIFFAIVLAPITALSLEHFSGQVKCIALLGLLFAFLRTPLPSTLFQDRPHQPVPRLPEA